MFFFTEPKDMHVHTIAVGFQEKTEQILSKKIFTSVSVSLSGGHSKG